MRRAEFLFVLLLALLRCGSSLLVARPASFIMVRSNPSRSSFAASSTFSSFSDNNVEKQAATRWQRAKLQWQRSCEDARRNPWTYLSIPIVAAIVGYVTNFVGVKMLFYPIEWQGIPLLRWPQQPLGLLGWQGIVPAKRIQMASKMVDVTISRLLKVSEVFNRLEPRRMAELLAPTLSQSGGIYRWIPGPLLRLYLRKTSRDLLRNIDQVVDVKSLVVLGMTTDPTVMGAFFQKVGAKELSFLIDSGVGFGFLLGIVQMLVWMIFPSNWTLPVGGAVVGYITNYIALKWIFEPLVPTRFGPFVLQGMFMRRQKEVSQDFCSYISSQVLTSQRVWASMLETGPASCVGAFKDIVSRNVPLPASAISNALATLKIQVGQRGSHSLHEYTNTRLILQATLVEKMNKLTPSEFEQVLHPIFQEDELTLILAGGVLGALAGLFQWGINEMIEKRRRASQNVLVKVEKQ